MGKKTKKIRTSVTLAGFTLIELLVVISIISMLMSILMPALSAAREQGRGIVCASNLRQFTFAWTLYTDENDGKLCSADTDWNNGWQNGPTNNWVADGPGPPFLNHVGGTEIAIKNGALWPDVRTIELYKCKSDPTNLLRSYAISRAMNGSTCNCEHDNINPFRTLSQISASAEKMVFTDAISRTEWIDGSFCPVKDVEAHPPKWFLSNSRNITARHNGGFNLSFADVHCERIRWKDPRTVALANWQIDPDEASDNNPDLELMVRMLKAFKYMRD